jgi:hypothetical protein
MPQSFNGIGTMYYGSAEPHDDGSHIVTEWVTFLWVPLLPLGSRRVWSQDSTSHWFMNQNTTNYKIVKVPLHLPHLLKGYGAVLAVVAAIQVIDYFHW